MKKEKGISPKERLRAQAQELLEKSPEITQSLTPDELKSVMEELRIHQVELEIQNEELRQAQQELEAVRDRLADLYDFSPVAYLTLGKNGMIIEANLTSVSLLGVERSRLIGQPFSHSIARDSQDNHYLHHGKLLETQASQTYEVKMKKKDGTTFYAQLDNAPVLDDDGNVRQVRIALADITKRKRAEDELMTAHDQLKKQKTSLEKANKELQDAREKLVRREKLSVMGQLAGGLSHELRTPLTAIKNTVYFLNMALKQPDSKVKEALDILNQEIAASERIIRSLLDFARPGPSSRHPVDINDVVRVSLSRYPVPENVEVVSQLDDTLPIIQADLDQLGRVFENLVLNALQAMPEGGQLVARSEAPRLDGVTVSISDTGVGMDEKTKEKIFEPLFTAKAKGIGLGLALANMVVQAHGGTIDVQSQMGKGTTFTVSIPLAKNEQQ